MLPEPSFAKGTSFWFKNVKADIYRLEAIQYIWGNAISAEYKKYLYKMLDLITELNPYFEWPYVVGEILLPSYNFRYEKLSDEQQNMYIEEAQKIGEKGIKNFCDEKKIQLIKEENNLSKLWTEEKYKDPCTSKRVPFYLAFIHYFYKNDPSTASYYYKITSAITQDAFEWAKIMAAIMQGKAGNRVTSAFMFLNLAKTADTDDALCQAFTNELERVVYELYKKTLPLTGNMVQEIQKGRQKANGDYDEEAERKWFWDSTCLNYSNKAVRELNLLYLETAHERYMKDHNGQALATPEELYEKKYIDFLPKDFQQYKAGYGIIYEYNRETKKYDYIMSEIP